MVLQLRHATPTARKQHRCDWCRGTIEPGTRYSRSTNIYDDRLYDWISCEPCDRLLTDVWDFWGAPDEGVDQESYQEWAHENRDREGARAYLNRTGCTCYRCKPEGGA